MTRYAVAASIALLGLLVAPARGADRPNSEKLRTLERQAEQSRAKATELAGRTARMQLELETQRQALTDAAEEVRSGEEALSRLEQERTALSERISRQSAVFAGERTDLARLTAALVRALRIPKGGLLVWPGAPIDIARSEMLLQSALEEVRGRDRRAQAELAELGALDRTLDAKRREAERAAADLKSQQAALATLIDKRQALYRQTDADRRTEEDRAEKIGGEAKDLRDLVAHIEADRQAEAQRKAAVRTASPPKSAGSANGLGLPVAGEIKVRFGQNDGLGTTSRGITVVARPGATVTAPAGGTVRFAGPFRGYREILILEHPDGYHSLIAGMARIDVTLGTSVGAGEPVGTMDDRQDTKPELYYELRRNGQPVEPRPLSQSR